MLAAVAAVVSIGVYIGFDKIKTNSISILNAEALTIDGDEIKERCPDGRMECERHLHGKDITIYYER